MPYGRYTGNRPAKVLVSAVVSSVNPFPVAPYIGDFGLLVPRGRTVAPITIFPATVNPGIVAELGHSPVTPVGAVQLTAATAVSAEAPRTAPPEGVFDGVYPSAPAT